MIVPNFVVSPGLLQKIYGARDDRAVRVGVGLFSERERGRRGVVHAGHVAVAVVMLARGRAGT